MSIEARTGRWPGQDEVEVEVPKVVSVSGPNDIGRCQARRSLPKMRRCARVAVEEGNEMQVDGGVLSFRDEAAISGWVG